MGQTMPLSAHSLFLPGEGDGSNVGFMYMHNYVPGGAVHLVFNETVRLIRAGLRKGPGSSIEQAGKMLPNIHGDVAAALKTSNYLAKWVD